MKTSAIVRIVLYSLVAVLLIGLLLTGLGIGSFIVHLSSGNHEYTTGGGSVEAAEITSLRVNWASGSVILQTGDTDQIIFEESGNFSEEYAMVYEVKNGKLKLEYAKPRFTIGFFSIPSKDLVITVPKSWICEELELDGAALQVEIRELSVQDLDIDGAACEVSFLGSLDRLNCDGAACELNITCRNRPQEFDLDGASCRLDLTIPDGCGFQVRMDGLSCHFKSDAEYTVSNKTYLYGDQHCRIDADGVSCEVTIRTNAE